MTDATRVSRSAAGCLILAAAANLTAVVLFTLRDGVNNGPPPTQAYLVLERGLFMAGMLVSAIGFSLLAERDRGSELMRFGTLGYFAAGIVGVVAETMELANAGAYPTTVAYVVLAFLGQAIIGLALARSDLVTPWLGWLTMTWNLMWLVGLSIGSPDDMYFPALHLLMPIPIGIALLRSPARPIAATA
jgi:mannose/fructose/N-acetylgalactosamine-specific phosphotransferase system component IIC